MPNVSPLLIHSLVPSAAGAGGRPAQVRPGQILSSVLIVASANLLLIISAKLQIPFWPVPMTMQSFVVVVLGLACGWRLGGLAVLLYLCEGAFGLPVFARGGGLAYFTGPTAGYLIGFLVSVFAVGWLAEQKGFSRTITLSLTAMLIGDALIFLFGVPWLAFLIGVEKALAVGLLPFLPAEAFKIALGALVLPACWLGIEKLKRGGTD